MQVVQPTALCVCVTAKDLEAKPICVGSSVSPKAQLLYFVCIVGIISQLETVSRI
jgi:hypothetical protein